LIWVDTARQITIGVTAAGIALSSFNIEADAATIDSKAPTQSYMVNLASKQGETSANKYLASSPDANKITTPTVKAYESENQVKKIKNIASQAVDFSIVGIPTSMDELAAQANQAAARKYAELENSDKDYTTDQANKLAQEAATLELNRIQLE
jgi:hypothetical protein